MNYCSEVKKVCDLSQIDSGKNGTLFLSDNQTIIDYCVKNNIPVAAFEHDDIKNLKCQNVLIDVDEVDDEVFENIYRREVGLPWDIGETDRTIIREFSMADLDDLFDLYSQPGLTDYMEPLFEYEEEKAYQQNYIEYIYKLYGYGMWLVFDKKTGRLIGRAGIETREETCNRAGMAELGFCISPARWHQGLAYEVCSKIIKLAFEEYEIDLLVSRCDRKNLASQGLLEKLGFKFTGYMENQDCRYELKKER